MSDFGEHNEHVFPLELQLLLSSSSSSSLLVFLVTLRGPWTTSNVSSFPRRYYASLRLSRGHSSPASRFLYLHLHRCLIRFNSTTAVMAARRMRCDERDKSCERKITLPRFPRECINNGRDVRTMKIDETLDTNRTNRECRRGRFWWGIIFKRTTLPRLRKFDTLSLLLLDFTLYHLTPISSSSLCN